MKSFWGHRIFWLATALSLWQSGCATNSNPARSNAATETSAAKVTSSTSTLDTAKAQRTLNLWVAAHAARIAITLGGIPQSSSVRIIGAPTPWRGDQNQLVVPCYVYIARTVGPDAFKADATFIRGPDGNWYLTSVGMDGDLNLKVE